jgi:metal-sulfur cluster biosynthetic enzyme
MGDIMQPSRDIVLEALRDVIDPELGYNIVDLGLVYALKVADSIVHITMTMTTPGCPAQDYIMMAVCERGLRIPGVKDVDVTLVWEPRWSPVKMVPAARTYFDIPDDPHE